jgi:DNA-binding MarR family transcriptional regulator
MPLTKLNNRIFRYTQAYMDGVLEKFQLSSGSYPFLLMLKENEGISQNKISKELNVDKAMSARTIKKLIELGYLSKIEDNYDSRAYKLYLTEKARAIIPKVIEELETWISLITEDLDEQEKILLENLLNKVLNSAVKYK